MATTRRFQVVAVGSMVLAMALTTARDTAAEEVVEAKWYLSAGAGLIDFEGDAWVKDSGILSARVGFDANDRWTLEAVLALAPQLDANKEAGASGFDSTGLVGLGVEGLFHFTRWDRLDPYLSAGVGMLMFQDAQRTGDKREVAFRGGGGVMYHFNDEWAVRADWVGMLRGFGESPSSSSIMDAGLVWYWGASVPVKLVAVRATDDSDGDGLTDREEEDVYGTNPYEWDTDRDRLSDGQEVKIYLTNPLDKDTDADMLTDGEEVLDYKTDPRNRDTDGGGVSDGHEVLEDGTDPKVGHGDDDLVLFEMYINFDFDKATISPIYYGQLDVIAKVLTRSPNATAKIEGHADKLKLSSQSHNKRLSETRATSAMDYLAGKGIAKKRMDAVGYGFDRPKYPNHPKDGNPLNRRVDVYIRGVDKNTLLADQAEFKSAAPATGDGNVGAPGTDKHVTPKNAADK
jgi:outer membrane protein OmpA-like peptidoglycan-associated protein